MLAVALLPAGSVAVAATVLAPSASGTSLARKEPSPATTAGTPLTTTEASASDTVPETSISAVATVAPSAGLVMETLGGAVSVAAGAKKAAVWKLKRVRAGGWKASGTLADWPGARVAASSTTKAGSPPVVVSSGTLLSATVSGVMSLTTR